MLSPEECSELHRSFVGDVLEGLKGFSSSVDVELHTDLECDAWSEFHLASKLQVGSDLGERMWNAANDALARGYEQAMILGSDAPTLPLSHLRALLDSSADVAFGPTEDGGYYAIKFRRLTPSVFEGVEWSTELTLQQSIAAAQRAGLSVELGPCWYDIDSPADLVRLVSEETPTRTKQWLMAHHFLIEPAVESI